ncbi:hypothetical protein Gorai_009171, partial [Gossypium raimondii]|nr:hypothetical protein [Gossypium raimondii]
MSNSLYVNNDGASLRGNTYDDSSLAGDQNTKNVLFKDPNPVLDLEMADEDYVKVLSEGPWAIFGQYLMVQPWIIDFNPAKPYPSVVMTWIRFLGLPGHMCWNAGTPT